EGRRQLPGRVHQDPDNTPIRNIELSPFESAFSASLRPFASLRETLPPHLFSGCTRMKWSVNAACAIGIVTLGMWQSMQPRSGWTGQDEPRTGRDRPGWWASLSGCRLLVSMAEWQSRHRASYQAAEVSTSRCGSWQVTQWSVFRPSV